METDSERIEQLQADVRRLEESMLAVNDALFGLAGILARAIVDAGVTDRVSIADAIEKRAGIAGKEDHNPLLLAFARAIWMNFPGGRFEVVSASEPPEVDPI